CTRWMATVAGHQQEDGPLHDCLPWGRAMPPPPRRLPPGHENPPERRPCAVAVEVTWSFTARLAARLPVPQGLDVRGGHAEPAEDGGREDSRRARAPQAEQLAEAEVAQAAVMPLAQGDERALEFDVVRKAVEDLLAGDAGLPVGQQFGDGPPGRRGRPGRVQRSVPAGQ